jgi:OFA family oxalate/formate antiporter-like MFS transporter
MTRWTQLALGIVAMVMIANLQYGWTLFVAPITEDMGWSKASVQWAFSLFIVMETWLLPVEGWLIDRVGPRWTVCAGGALIGASWVLNAVMTSLPVLYLAAAIGGLGAGMIYGATVGNALKWFPDRRGLAAGLTAAGFGAGSAVTIVPIAAWIAAYGYRSAFMAFGLGQGVIVMIVALFLAAPPPADSTGAMAAAAGSGLDRRPAAVIRHRAFWLMYAMFVMVGAGGLMATAQLAVIADDFGVAKTPVSVLGITLPALTFALSLDRILNGFTRPFFGFVSDYIGREITMFIAFMLEGFGILALVVYAKDPVAFVVLSGFVFFAWGEIYSLFPALCGDMFGRRYATANYGMLYTAKGTAALLVPLGSWVRDISGDWTPVFYLAAALNIAAAVMAVTLLRPWRLRDAGLNEGYVENG